METPPGFLVRTEAEKAAADNGYRIVRGVKNGAWLQFASTTARGEIWIAGAPPRGPWLLSIDHPGVASELANLTKAPVAGPGLATFLLDTTTRLHAILDRVYKLGVSLPDAPLARFRAETAGLPRTTEAERLVVQRVGQGIFRDALLDYWGGRCAVTGLAVPELLRASHIKPWSEATDAERLDIFNGLLLSPNLDAAFDRGFITIDEAGSILVSPQLPDEARKALALDENLRVRSLGTLHQTYLEWHRKHLFRTIL